MITFEMTDIIEIGETHSLSINNPNLPFTLLNFDHWNSLSLIWTESVHSKVFIYQKLSFNAVISGDFNAGSNYPYWWTGEQWIKLVKGGGGRDYAEYSTLLALSHSEVLSAG